MFELAAQHPGARRGARVAVGHTRDDQAETVLARLLRGAGVRGLGAIVPRRADGVIRPLLDCTRAQVETYLSHRRLSAVRDPSNADRGFLRTRVRTDLLPRLLEEDPALLGHLSDLSDEARALTAWVDAEARALAQRADAPSADDSSDPNQGVRALVAALGAAPEPLRRAALRVLVEGATGRLPSRAQVEAIDRMLSRPEGDAQAREEAVRLGGGWVARRAEEALIVRREPDARGHADHAGPAAGGADDSEGLRRGESRPTREKQ